MNRRHTALVGLAAAAALGLVAGQATTAVADRGGTTVNHGTLMELNDSGVSGTVTVLDKGDHLRVNLDASGLEPNRLHMQHIHGFGDGTQATCPDMSNDGGDGVLSFADGLPFYGGVVVTLGRDHVMGDDLTYSRVFEETDAEADVSTMGALSQYVVVVHGLTLSGAYDASTPVACAVLEVRGNQGDTA